jgi:hypothetical protein
VVGLGANNPHHKKTNLLQNVLYSLRPGQILWHNLSISAVRRGEFVSDKMLYIILRGFWCNIIVLNMHAPSEDKSEDLKMASMRNQDIYLINFLGTI